MNTRNGTPFGQCELALSVSNISGGNNTATSFPFTNSVGTVNAGRTEYTWYNLNMKDILGDLYDKFEFFNLSLRSVQSIQGIGTYGSLSANDRLINIVATGPNWRNATYDVATRRSTRQAVIGQFTAGTGSFGSNFNDSCITTFEKSPIFDFTMKLQTITGTPPAIPDTTTTMFPIFSYYFIITPAMYPTGSKLQQVY